MASSQTIMVRPTYLRDFSCTISGCSDTCCKHWEVQIDRETYDKYTAGDCGEFSVLMNEYLSLKPEPDRSDALYGVIAHMENGYCPFLSPERACRLHAEFGPEFLSNACALYPRATNMIDGVCEQAGDVSCPVMAELVLGRKDGIQFEEGEFEYERMDRQLFFEVADTSEAVMSEVERDMLLRIREFSMAMLSDRSMTLDLRLLAMEEYHRAVSHMIRGGDYEGVIVYSEDPDMAGMKERAVDDLDIDISGLVAGQLEELLALISAYDPGTLPGIDRYNGLYREFVLGMGYSEGILLGDLAGVYMETRKRLYDPFIEEHEYLMENYLLNDYFKRAEPFTGYETGDVYAGFFKLVQKFSLMRLILAGVAGFRSKLSKESFIEVVQIVSRIIETNYNYAAFVEQYTAENIDNSGYARKFIV